MRTRTAPQMARVSALLYGCSSFFVTATIVLPHPAGADIAGLWIVAGVALLASVAIFTLSDRFSTGTITPCSCSVPD